MFTNKILQKLQNGMVRQIGATRTAPERSHRGPVREEKHRFFLLVSSRRLTSSSISFPTAPSITALEPKKLHTKCSDRFLCRLFSALRPFDHISWTPLPTHPSAHREPQVSEIDVSLRNVSVALMKFYQLTGMEQLLIKNIMLQWVDIHKLIKMVT